MKKLWKKVMCGVLAAVLLGSTIVPDLSAYAAENTVPGKEKIGTEASKGMQGSEPAETVIAAETVSGSGKKAEPEKASVSENISRTGNSSAAETNCQTEIPAETEPSLKPVTIKADCVDQCGDVIDAAHSGMTLPDYDANGYLELTQGQPGCAIANITVTRGSDAKQVNYVYESAVLDGQVIRALKRETGQTTQTEQVTQAQQSGQTEQVTQTQQNSQTAVSGNNPVADNNLAAATDSVPATDSASTAVTAETVRYFYTTDGSSWSEITSDQTIRLNFNSGKKISYVYEDEQIKVIATLQHADAIPDDAALVATPLTRDSKEYNYDAYLQALNAHANAAEAEEAPVYDDTNVLLYDVGFFRSENGKEVELEPVEGSVYLSMIFKKQQLQDTLGIHDKQSVKLIHLPLAEGVKQQAEPTADVTDITAADIEAQPIQDVTFSLERNEAEFSLSSFSVMGIVGETKDSAGVPWYWSKDPAARHEAGDQDVFNGGNYDLIYIMQNYSVFTQGDFSGSHVVGPVAVGGNTAVSLGGLSHYADGKTIYKHTASSYFGKGIFQALTDDRKGKPFDPATASAYGDWGRDLITGTDNLPVYLSWSNWGSHATKDTIMHYLVRTKDDGSSFDYKSGEIYNGNADTVYSMTKYSDTCIDFDAAFQALKNQASGIQSEAAKVCHISGRADVGHLETDGYELRSGVLTIKIGGSIDIDDYDSIKRIQIIGDQSARNNTIFTGNSAGKVTLPQVVTGTMDGNGTFTADVGTKEVNENGTSIAFFLPNAIEVVKPGTGLSGGGLSLGHIVAPSGKITVTSGDTQGCMIAKDGVFSAAEAHMYPFNVNKITINGNASSLCSKTVDGKAPGERAKQFTFELTGADDNGKTKVASVEQKENDAKGNISFAGLSVVYTTDDLEKQDTRVYCYEVREVNDKQENIVYDRSVYRIEDTVTKSTVLNGTTSTTKVTVVRRIYQTVDKNGTSLKGADGSFKREVSVIQFQNLTSHAMPETGGTGTDSYTVTGLFLLILFAEMCFMRNTKAGGRKKRDKDSEPANPAGE